MPVDLWIGFVLASCILLIIPGPTTLTVTSYSIAHGSRANVPLIAAVALGDSSALALSLLGIGALMSTSAWLFTIVKWVGGLYLIYLGIRLLLSKSDVDDIDTGVRLDSTGKLFLSTWLVTALNPKGILFFVAFLPQFTSHSQNPIKELWILSITFVVLATLNASLYAFFALSARRLLQAKQARKRFKLCGGMLLMIAGVWALSAQRNSL